MLKVRFLMSPNDYRAAIASFGLSINDAGRFFGGSDVQGRRWAMDGPPGPVVLMIELMMALDLRPEDVDSEIGRWKRRTGR